MQHANIYGLDIETDTDRDGLDPTVAPVVMVALSGRKLDEVFCGPEPELLAALDARLANLEPGVIATWNGSTFDLPFIADRARILDLDLGLQLCLDRSLTMNRAPLPGHAGAYRAEWHRHTHIDTFRLYGNPSPSSHWTSLRVIGRVLGLGTSSGHDAGRRTQILTNEALHAHAPSDARLARVLAERRWSAAARLVDRVEPVEAEVVSVAAGRLERQARLSERAVAARPAHSVIAPV
jgi:DNA polymerase elongation subunit (family B)